MTTAREELRWVTHMLRCYIEEQRAAGVRGLSPAPQEQRDRWEEHKSKREQAKLDRIRSSLHDGAGQEQTQSRPQPPAQQGPPSRPAAPEHRERPATAASQDPPTKRDVPKKPGESFLDREQKKPAAAPQIASGGEGAIWKQFGSRPVELFKKGEPEKPARSSKQKERPGGRPERDQSGRAAMSGTRQSGPATSNPTPAPEESQESEFTEVIRRGDPSPSLFGEEWDESQDPTRSAQPLPGFDKTASQIKRLGQMDNEQKLDFLRQCLGDCTRCKLSQKRNNIVFGEGSPNAQLVFIGEGPGFNEDKTGRPFVGNAGNLLDRMIKAMGTSREEVYICNVVKCRPPNNRNPEAEEIRHCAPFLYKQLETLQPRAIVTLGKFAGQTLLGIEESMGRMRGRWHDWRGVPVMPTYHPAYLLRRQQEGDRRDKGRTWDDLQKVMKLLGLEQPSK